MVDKVDAGEIGELAKQGRADSAQSKGETEEQPGHGADSSWHQLLGVYQNRGKRGSEDQSDDDAQDAGPKQIGIRQDQGERQNAKNGAPDDQLAAELVAHRPAEKCPRRHRTEEQGQVELRALDGKVKAVHQVEGVITDEAREVKEFGEHQGDQDGET